MSTFGLKASALALAILALSPHAAFAVVAGPGPVEPGLAVSKNSPAAGAFRQGIQKLVDGDLKAAQSAFEEAARLDPKAPEPLVGLADIALRQGRAKDALNELKKAETLAPASAAVQLGLGRYYVSQHDLAGAEQSFKRAIQLQPSAVPARLELADLYLQQGKTSESVDQLQQAVKVRPDSAQAQYRLGVALSIANRPKDAEAAFQAAAKLAPKDVATQQALARLYAEQKRYDDALAHIDDAIALAPKWSQLYVDRGDILAGKGDLRGAEAAYRKAVELDPKNAAALNNVAWLLADRRASLDEALDFAKRATSLEPTNAVLADTLGWVYRARKDLPKAIEAFENAVRLAPRMAEPHYHLGLVLAEAGRRPQARAEFEQALGLGLAGSRAADARKQLAALAAP